MEIRTAVVDDTPSLGFLRRERAVLLQQSDSRLTLPQADFTTALTDRNYAILVGEVDEQVVGYILGYVSSELPSDVGVIEELTLNAHQYHGGIGRRLYNALQTWFASQGVTRVLIRVPRYHAVEQAFWRSLGATEDLNPILPTSSALVWMQL